MYCTRNDIDAPLDDLVQLTDDDGVGAVNEAVVERAIVQAGELIDGYLRGRYALPLDPVPGLLTSLAATITLRRLYSRRTAVTVPESLADDYRNALKILENIQKGTIALGAGAPETTVAQAAPVVLATGPERMFTRERLRDY